MSNLRNLLPDPLWREALRRRAARHWRTPRHELLAIIYEALEPELEALRAEQQGELPDEPREEVRRDDP